VQEVQGKADAEATRIYGQAYNKNPEFYAFLRTLESYKEKTNMNSVLILTTDSDFYQYIKNAKSEDPIGPSAGFIGCCHEKIRRGNGNQWFTDDNAAPVIAIVRSAGLPVFHAGTGNDTRRKETTC
jgi:hypothetical protein